MKMFQSDGYESIKSNGPSTIYNGPFRLIHAVLKNGRNVRNGCLNFLPRF